MSVICIAFSGTIFSAHVSDPKPGQVVYKADHVIDDLVVDSQGARLYWTAYNAGFIAMLDIASGDRNVTHDVIVSSLTSPRAVVIDVINRCVPITPSDVYLVKPPPHTYWKRALSEC